MIYGIGIDIIKVERMKEAVERWGERFLQRVFTGNEISYCYGKKNPYLSLSVRFAAKEAMIKALGLRGSVTFRDIEILNDAHGKPAILARGELDSALRRNSIRHSHLSLSHERDYGIAFVVLERDDNP
ncbi:MAG: holo-ACP synthase [Nitrospirae bacterium]|nr:holo-ACP synthase [Nitrospirota bacterium]MCL5421164.1 holo-ACP synthase [Nitrospirota bacterium]